MPQKSIPIQSSFSAGEISPLLHGRTDTEGYSQGCQRLQNMFSTSQGPVRTRPGTKFLGFLNDTQVRVVPFQITQAQAFFIVLSNLNATIFDVGGPVSGVEGITNGYFQTDLTGWTIDTENVIWDQERMRLISNLGSTTGADVWQAVTGLTPGGGYALRFDLEGPADQKIRLITETAEGLADIETIDLRPDIGIERVITGPTLGQVIVRFQFPTQLGSEQNGGLRPMYIRRVQLGEIAVLQSYTTPWTQGELVDLQYAQSNEGNSMYFVHPRHNPQKLTYTDPQNWTIAPVDFTGKKPLDPEWTGTNWPSAITFFQGRMWLAATPTSPERLWGSKSGELEDFTPPPAMDPTADDSIQITLADKGRIHWLLGKANLLIGTENREFLLGGSGNATDGDVVTGASFNLDEQSAYGSRGVQAISIGNQGLYISPDGKKVRAIGYAWQESQWISQDLTFASEHITGTGIRALSFAQNPEHIVWAVSDDGELIGVTYERALGITGWHRHTTRGSGVGGAGPAGIYLDVGSIELFGLSKTMVAVLRNNANNVWRSNLELMDPGSQLDAYVIRREADTATLDQVPIAPLVGYEVAGVSPQGVDQFVIYLEDEQPYQVNVPTDEIRVGIPIIAEMETLPLDTLRDRGQTTQALKGRLPKLDVLLRASNYPEINGQLPPERSPQDLMNQADPPKTEAVRVHDNGHERRKTVTIRQIRPVPLEVQAIWGEYSEGGL